MKSSRISGKRFAILFLLITGVFGSAAMMRTIPLRSAQAPERSAEDSRTASGTEPGVSSQNASMEMHNGDVPEPLYRSILGRIRVLRFVGSLGDVKLEGDMLESQWGSAGGVRYGLLVRELVIALHSGTVKGDQKDLLELSDKYSRNALEKADTFELETEVFLLRYLGHRLGDNPLSDGKIQDRRKRLDSWLHAVRRLYSEIDQNYDPNDMPFLNVPLPKGVRGMAGMSPEQIKDPKLRAEYEKAIEENIKKSRFQNNQRQLRDIEKPLIRDATEHISKMYSQLPTDIGELVSTLKSSGISRTLQELMVNETKKAIDGKPTGMNP